MKSRHALLFIIVLSLVIPNLPFVPVEAYDTPIEAQLQLYEDIPNELWHFTSLDNDKVEIRNNEGIPEFTLSKWDGEVSLSGTIIPFDGETEFELEIEEGKIKWKGKWKTGELEKEVEVEFEPTLDSEYGGFEWNTIIFDNSINSFSIPLQSENLTFHYQPPLTEREGIPEEWFRNATHIIDENGTVRGYRPENVVGSYAVYHKSKSGDYSQMGGKNYRTGKAFHIYRPYLVDALGSKAWAELDISNGLLTITLPQEFLDAATYPVTIDPTFGFTSIGESTTSTPAGGYTRGILATPASGGTATSVSGYIWYEGSTPGGFKMGLYEWNDGSNSPRVRLTAPEDMKSSAQWHTIALTSPATITQIQYVVIYWVLVQQHSYKYDDVNNALKAYSDDDGPPAVIGTWAGPWDDKISIYCTYTANANPTITSASISDRDDTDNLYAMKKYYTFTAVVNDADGATDISEVNLKVLDGTTPWFEVKAGSLTGTPSYSIISGSSLIDLDAGGCSWQENGNVGTATFKIRIEGDHPQANDLEIAVYVKDSSGSSAGWTNKQTNYFDIINRLVTTGFAASDGRINVGGTATLSGSVRYATTTTGNTASSSYPINTVFTCVYIHDSGHVERGADATISSGAFSASFSIPTGVQSNTYHVYLDMTGGFSDGDAPNGDTAAVIGDRVHVTAKSRSDSRTNVYENEWVQFTLKFDYDEAAVTTGTVTIEGYSASHQGSSVWRTSSHSKSSVQKKTYNEFTTSGNAHGITATDMNGYSTSITWDRIEFYYQALDDSRVNLNSNIEYRVKARLDYDNHALGASDSLTANSGAMTWDATNGWYDDSRSQASVGSYVFSVTSASEATYGITARYDGVSDPTGIWDRVEVYSFVLDDSRVNIGTDIEVRVKARLDYDNHELGSGDTLVLNIGAGTWDSGNGWFEDWKSQETVSDYEFQVSSASETTYGITDLYVGVSNPTGIWDKVNITSFSVEDDRISVDSEAIFDLEGIYDYDSTSFSGTGNVNDTTTKSVVGKYWYNLTSINDPTHGITVYYATSFDPVSVIFDRINITGMGNDDGRREINTTGTFWATAILDYDSHALGDGDSLNIEGKAMSWVGGNSRFEYGESKSTSQIVTYDTYTSGNETTYGITAGTIDGFSTSIIWDRVELYQVSTNDTRINIGTSAELRYKLRYEYDSADINTSSSFTVGGISVVWDSGDSWWDVNITQSSSVTSTTWDKDDIGAFTDTGYNITVIFGSGTVNVITDRVLLTSFYADNTFVKVGTTVTLYATFELEYDGHVPDGDDSLTLEGVEFTWDWQIEEWTAEVSRDTAVSVTYDEFTAVVEYTYIITVGSMDGLSVTVTWSDLYYDFLGLYNENGTKDGGVELSVHLPSDLDVFEVDGNVSKGYTEPVEMISWPLSGGGMRYVFPGDFSRTIYLFDPDDTYSVYSFKVKDYIGMVGTSNIYLESLRSINGTRFLVERKKIGDISNTIPLTLVHGRIYILQVRFDDNSTYSFGYFTPGTDTSLTLRIKGLFFSENIALSSKDVFMEGTRPNPTHLRGNFMDTKEEATFVLMEVWYRSNYTVVYSVNSTETTVQFNWYDAHNETDYIIHIEATHPRYPGLQRNFPVAGVTGSFASPPSLAILGTWGPLDAALILPTVILLIAANLTDERNVEVGAFILWCIAAGMSYIGWYPNSGAKLAVVFIFIVIMALGGGGRRR